jgi:periplasmic divalent cation tolerance protein
MPETTCVLVLTTLPMDADLLAFARALVEGRLAACINVLPEMHSVYRWHEKVEEARERQVLMKTTRDRVQQLRERVRALHPYEVPEFIVLPIIDGSDMYLRWIAESTEPGSG